MVDVEVRPLYDASSIIEDQQFKVDAHYATIDDMMDGHIDPETFMPTQGEFKVPYPYIAKGTGILASKETIQVI